MRALQAYRSTLERSRKERERAAAVAAAVLRGMLGTALPVKAPKAQAQIGNRHARLELWSIEQFTGLSDWNTHLSPLSAARELPSPKGSPEVYIVSPSRLRFRLSLNHAPYTPWSLHLRHKAAQTPALQG